MTGNEPKNLCLGVSKLEYCYSGLPGKPEMCKNQSLNIWQFLPGIYFGERFSVHKELGFTSLHISIKRYFLLNCCRTSFLSVWTFGFLEVVCSCVNPVTLSYSKQHLIFAYLNALVWWRREEGSFCANLTPTPYSLRYRTLYMSFAQWWSWNTHPKYFLFWKYWQCDSLLPAGNYRNRVTLPSLPLHLSTLKRRRKKK